MAALNSLASLVLLKCPGPVGFLVEDALAKAYREFCIKSEYLNQTHTFDDGVKGKGGELVLVAGDGHYIQKVSVFSVHGERKTPLKANGVDYSQYEAGTLIFNAAHQKIEVVSVLCPTPAFNRDDVNAGIINRWADEIASGAAAELRIMPGKEWSAPELYENLRADLVGGWRDAMRIRREQFSDFTNSSRPRTFY